MTLSRRDFLATSATCSAHVALAALASSASARLLWAQPRSPTVAREPFGSLEQVSDGVWALISTPLGGDRTTLSNGGLVAGRNGVLAIEGFNQPEGARWLATKAKELTGHWPTHVVLTHYHADHANGVAGYVTGGDTPQIRSTAATRALVLERNTPADASRAAALADAVILDGKSQSSIELGGRSVRVIPLGGHTASDCIAVVDGQGVTFTGDLVWNGMFPNYVDAVPSELSRSVTMLRGLGARTYVPGHGAVATSSDVDRYEAMLGEIEHAARAAHARGQSAKDAGAEYALPASLGQWVLFNKVFFERAFGAWYREIA